MRTTSTRRPENGRDRDDTGSALDQYMREVNRYPVLTREQEKVLALRFHETGEADAKRRLVQANLRFVVKVAFQYKSYRLDIIDLIQEGNVGLITAIERFDPDSGNRLLSYAVWWIKAGIQAYIARTWALVRVLPSSQQRRILFGRHRLEADGSRESREPRQTAAKRAKPGRKMSERRAGATAAKASHNGTEGAGATRANRGEFEGWHKAANAARHYMPIDGPVVDEGRLTLTETLAAPEPDAECRYGDHEVRLAARARINHVRERLTDAQRRVLDDRILAESPATLQELSDALSISRERVRQVELSVKRKLERKLRPVMRAI